MKKSRALNRLTSGTLRNHRRRAARLAMVKDGCAFGAVVLIAVAFAIL